MFRDFTKRCAQKMGLRGTVQNRADGTVAVLAQGEENTLRSFTERLQKGSILARVKSVEVRWSDPTEIYNDFTIVYSSFLDRI